MKRTMVFNGLVALMLTAAVALMCPLTAVAQLSGMVSYWRFDEGTGSIATDSASENDGTIYGNLPWVPGISQSALRFDGAWDDYIAFSQDLNVVDEMTVEVWVKPDFDPADPNDYPSQWPGVRNIIRKSANFNDTFWLLFGALHYGYPTLSFAVFYEGGGSIGAEPLDLRGLIFQGEWYHIVGTFKRGNFIKLYVNGEVKIVKSTADKPIRASSKKLVVSQLCDLAGGETCPNHPQTWRGLIDEVAIYNTALSAEEIQQHYQNGLAGLGYDSPTLEASKEISGMDRNAATPIFDVFAGDMFTYTIEIENSFAQAVYFMVSDTLDVALEYVLDTFAVDGSPAGNDAFATGDLLSADHLLGAGEMLSFSFTVEVQDVLVGSVIDNTAWMTAYMNPLDILGTTLAVIEAIAPQAHVVPEPSTLLLFGIGMIGGSALLRSTRRRKKT